ncbi:hypothetical protein HD806DRAFT_260690 [Xylariaceae sp. AK1471]|nr:hypothetical protein HD806DRAFT_260690 [Xylariaceae sp. AK1471]
MNEELPNSCSQNPSLNFFFRFSVLIRVRFDCDSQLRDQRPSQHSPETAACYQVSRIEVCGQHWASVWMTGPLGPCFVFLFRVVELLRLRSVAVCPHGLVCVVARRLTLTRVIGRLAILITVSLLGVIVFVFGLTLRRFGIGHIEVEWLREGLVYEIESFEGREI